MGKKAITLKEVAREAGCHVTVASRVLNSEKGEKGISDTLRMRVEGAAEKLNYKPSAASRMMRTRRSCIVGALVKNQGHSPLVHSSTYEEILGITDKLQRHDLMLNLIRMSDLRRESSFSQRVFHERLLDGIIVVSCPEIPDEAADEVDELGSNVIWMHSNVWRDTDCIRLDEFQAGFSMTEFAHTLGYRKVVYVYRPEATHFSHKERRAGVREYARNSTLELEMLRLRNRAAAAEFQAVMDHSAPDTAIVACSVRIAEDLLYHFAMSFLKMGTDFGFACCGSKRDFIDALPQLTRMDSRRCELGMQSAAMMINKLDRDGAPQPSQVIQLELILGSTLKPQND